jgi:putative endonuclease
MDRKYFVYILASQRNGTLHIGMTNDLLRQVLEHRKKLIPGFAKKYGVKMLGHIEAFEYRWDAILRETRPKKWRREWKIDSIQQTSLEWDDLYENTRSSGDRTGWPAVAGHDSYCEGVNRSLGYCPFASTCNMLVHTPIRPKKNSGEKCAAVPELPVEIIRP